MPNMVLCDHGSTLLPDLFACEFHFSSRASRYCQASATLDEIKPVRIVVLHSARTLDMVVVI